MVQKGPCGAEHNWLRLRLALVEFHQMISKINLRPNPDKDFNHSIIQNGQNEGEATSAKIKSHNKISQLRPTTI
jgi:hypothetical protein